MKETYLETQLKVMTTEKHYEWLNDKSRKFLDRGYVKDGESIEHRVQSIARTAEKHLYKGFAEKFETYMASGWISLSSPIWSNFGAGRGLPISCNGSYVEDTMDGILTKAAEIGMMTKHGAGTSAYFGSVRGRGAKISTGGDSLGTVHFMELYDCITNVVSQANIRRGACACYLPIDHADIMEFLEIREEGNAIKKLHLGICISDEWMHAMIKGDKDKRKVWLRVIRKRFESGYPYLFFTDNVNNNKPQVYKDKELKIYASNLCSEIMLPSSPEESFVCDLSSLNLLHYDNWKTTDVVQTLTEFLDAVMSDYIEKTAHIPFMKAAHDFAKNHRALGIGVVGWHSYLQSKMISFSSMKAKLLNTEIWKLIEEKSHEASRKMAKDYGEPPLLKGYGMRNTTTMAIAPTTSSSFILGQVSPSVEPLHSNYFVKDLQKGKFTYKNPYLQKILRELEQDNAKTWEGILLKGGSVQHLTFLSEEQKAVFRTFEEISQKEIIIQAAARQKYIDQGQSLNLMIHPKVAIKDVNELYIFAWRQGIKSLYYQRSSNLAQELGRSILSCESCEA